MPINYARRQRIQDKCLDNGVRDVDVELFIHEFERGDFEEPDMTPEFFERQKQVRPQRFFGATSVEDELHRKAFVEGNLTAQGEIVKQVGLVAANEIAARYGVRVGSTQKGTNPDKSEDAEKRANPWLDDSPASLRRRVELIKSAESKKLPSAMIARLAHAAGKTLGGKPLRKS